jgi:hypothetical protein
MKASKKIVSINIEYYDESDLITALYHLKTQLLHHNKDYGRQKVNTAFIEYGKIKEYGIEPREEIIGGKLCLVIESKLNFD